MDPCSQYNAFTFGHVLLILLTRDRQHLALVSCQRLTERFTLHILLLDRVGHDRVQLLPKLSVSVRVAVRKIHVIVLILEVIRERHRIQGLTACIVLPYSIGVVSDFVAVSVPTDILLLRLAFRVDENFHAFIV